MSSYFQIVIFGRRVIASLQGQCPCFILWSHCACCDFHHVQHKLQSRYL